MAAPTLDRPSLYSAPTGDAVGEPTAPQLSRIERRTQVRRERQPLALTTLIGVVAVLLSALIAVAGTHWNNQRMVEHADNAAALQTMRVAYMDFARPANRIEDALLAAEAAAEANDAAGLAAATVTVTSLEDELTNALTSMALLGPTITLGHAAGLEALLRNTASMLRATTLGDLRVRLDEFAATLEKVSAAKVTWFADVQHDLGNPAY